MNLNTLVIDCSDGLNLAVYSLKTGQWSFFKGASKSDTVLIEIDRLLKSAGLKPSDLHVVGVGVGPGSFTGIRVAVSVAKGFFAANDLRARGAKSLKLIKFDSFEKMKEKGKFKIVDGFSSFVYVRTDSEGDRCVDVSELKLEIKPKDVVVCDEWVYNKIGKGRWVSPKNSLMEVAKAKIDNKEFVSVGELEPKYLRASQAELNLKH